ncbi:hypothetical protein WH87_08280 [Devosia epidermidihirudinis]|uniref:Uncharacterized protein n=1 Tax=Devosia epidermidihirudinis TaxID=1293439 RepID=A0A0F5QD22_9HYPH|nr:hypothetical protein [Devosia epidermidihirudinis]KKC38865.1 hypothetical protein WH87_08280 [Devosia epidermidihirudinis]
MNDIYGDSAQSLLAPASGAYTVVPSDTVSLPQVSRAIYVGAAGNVTLEMLWGPTVTFSNVAAGSILPVRARKVLTSSTASFMVGLY